MSLGQRFFFSFVHSSPHLVDPGKGNLRHGQLHPTGPVYEVDIPKLEAGNRRRADIATQLSFPAGCALPGMRCGFNPAAYTEAIPFTPTAGLSNSLIARQTVSFIRWFL